VCGWQYYWPKRPNGTRKEGNKQNRETANQSDHDKKPKACMHKCINANTKNEAKTPQKKKKTNTGKRGTPDKH